MSVCVCVFVRPRRRSKTGVFVNANVVERAEPMAHIRVSPVAKGTQFRLVDDELPILALLLDPKDGANNP